MKPAIAVLAALLATTAAMAADKPQPKPCPKGQITTTSKLTGDRVCFGMQGMVVGPMQPVTRPATKPPAKKRAAP